MTDRNRYMRGLLPIRRDQLLDIINHSKFCKYLGKGLSKSQQEGVDKWEAEMESLRTQQRNPLMKIEAVEGMGKFEQQGNSSSSDTNSTAQGGSSSSSGNRTSQESNGSSHHSHPSDCIEEPAAKKRKRDVATWKEPSLASTHNYWETKIRVSGVRLIIGCKDEEVTNFQQQILKSKGDDKDQVAQFCTAITWQNVVFMEEFIHHHTGVHIIVIPTYKDADHEDSSSNEGATSFSSLTVQHVEELRQKRQKNLSQCCKTRVVAGFDNKSIQRIMEHGLTVIGLHKSHPIQRVGKLITQTTKYLNQNSYVTSNVCRKALCDFLDKIACENAKHYTNQWRCKSLSLSLRSFHSCTGSMMAIELTRWMFGLPLVQARITTFVAGIKQLEEQLRSDDTMKAIRRKDDTMLNFCDEINRQAEIPAEKVTSNQLEDYWKKIINDESHSSNKSKAVSVISTPTLILATSDEKKIYDKKKREGSTNSTLWKWLQRLELPCEPHKLIECHDNKRAGGHSNWSLSIQHQLTHNLEEVIKLYKEHCCFTRHESKGSSKWSGRECLKTILPYIHEWLITEGYGNISPLAIVVYSISSTFKPLEIKLWNESLDQGKSICKKRARKIKSLVAQIPCEYKKTRSIFTIMKQTDKEDDEYCQVYMHKERIAEIESTSESDEESPSLRTLTSKDREPLALTSAGRKRGIELIEEGDPCDHQITDTCENGRRRKGPLECNYRINRRMWELLSINEILATYQNINLWCKP